MPTRTHHARRSFRMTALVVLAGLGLNAPALARDDGPHYSPVMRTGKAGSWYFKVRDGVGYIILDLHILHAEGIQRVSKDREASSLPEIRLQHLGDLDNDALDALAAWKGADSIALDDVIAGFDFRRLRHLPWLRSLSISDPRFGDVDLRALAALPALRGLRLRKCQVSDAGVRELSALPALRSLDLSGTRISDAGLARLVEVRPELESLKLEQTNTTDLGLGAIGRLEHLKSLVLSRTRISDAGLDHLTGLTALRGLDLSGVPLTDAGLLKLKRLNGLRTLKLFDMMGEIESDQHKIAALEALEPSFELIEIVAEPLGIVVEWNYLVREIIIPKIASDYPTLNLPLVLLDETRPVGFRIVEALTNPDLLDAWFECIGQSFVEAGRGIQANIDGNGSDNRTRFTDATLAELRRAIPELKVIRNDDEQFKVEFLGR